MDDKIRNLHDLCETLSREIKKANAKIEKANGELTAGDIEYIDKLTHSLKSVKSTMAMMGSEDYSNDGSYGGSYRRYSRDGYSGRRSYDGSYDDEMGSYGRGRNARRDSMGRYASDGYSRNASMVDELRDLMQDAPDDRTRQEMQRLINKMESM